MSTTQRPDPNDLSAWYFIVNADDGLRIGSLDHQSAPMPATGDLMVLSWPDPSEQVWIVLRRELVYGAWFVVVEPTTTTAVGAAHVREGL